ncbi:hypothetical protein GQ457_05G028980 [Hibiscus cannabinus]
MPSGSTVGGTPTPGAPPFLLGFPFLPSVGSSKALIPSPLSTPILTKRTIRSDLPIFTSLLWMSLVLPLLIPNELTAGEAILIRKRLCCTLHHSVFFLKLQMSLDLNEKWSL